MYTAGPAAMVRPRMAMVVPVFEGEKLESRRLTYACVMEYSLFQQFIVRNLPRTFSSLNASKVATRGLRPSQIFMAIFERETSAQIHKMLV